jgi:hypothetical protein
MVAHSCEEIESFVCDWRATIKRAFPIDRSIYILRFNQIHDMNGILKRTLKASFAF